jgi:hypothetical protein
MMTLRAKGWCGFDGVVGSRASWGRRHRELGEDNGVAGLGTVWVNGITGSGTVPGAHRHGLREDNIVAGSETTSRAWGRCMRGRWRHWLGSGKMAARKGARSWLGTMRQRL